MDIVFIVILWKCQFQKHGKLGMIAALNIETADC